MLINAPDHFLNRDLYKWLTLRGYPRVLAKKCKVGSADIDRGCLVVNIEKYKTYEQDIADIIGFVSPYCRDAFYITGAAFDEVDLKSYDDDHDCLWGRYLATVDLLMIWGRINNMVQLENVMGQRASRATFTIIIAAQPNRIIDQLVPLFGDSLTKL